MKNIGCSFLSLGTKFVSTISIAARAIHFYWNRSAILPLAA